MRVWIHIPIVNSCELHNLNLVEEQGKDTRDKESTYSLLHYMIHIKSDLCMLINS